MSSAMSTNWLMVTISLLPRLIGTSQCRCAGSLRAHQAIVNIHEAAGLVAVAPDFDFMFARLAWPRSLCGRWRRALFPGRRRRCRAGHRHCDNGRRGCGARNPPEMAAHPFAEQFFPAVAVLGHRGIGVGFLQGGDVRGRSVCRRRRRRRRRRRKSAPRPAAFAAMSRCVLMSTVSMQSALLFSMKPMPPMSAARL